MLVDEYLIYMKRKPPTKVITPIISKKTFSLTEIVVIFSKIEKRLMAMDGSMANN